jgi:hypothetical protein
MPRAFVIRPFGTKMDSKQQAIDFENVQSKLIGPAIAATGLEGSTTVEIESAGNIRADMFALILEADLVICDITVHNANVFYELGVRHALRRRGTVLIKGTPSADTTPFDLSTDRYLAYSVDKPEDAKDALIRMINATLGGDRVSDSPVFAMMPGLPEVDPTVVQALPIAFAEEVSRAVASQSKGWLRLLAEDVQGRRFERAGLRLVGTAQWKLKDFLAARESLETIREVYPNDVTAGLALANVYERLAKKQTDPTLLVKSDQSIARVLENGAATQEERVEALSLRGRNLKTLWRWEFEGTPDVADRRKRAMNQQLRASYAAYRDAFQQNQNNFWSGLGALQMGTIILDLSKTLLDVWRLSFDNDDEADAALAALRREIDVLRFAVRSSIDADLARQGRGSAGALWARVSQADLLFAENASDDRTFKRYSDVLPELGPFDWDAVRNQLDLFAGLGVRTELANKIIAAGDAMERPTPPKHTVIIFAGHQPDLTGRATPRFPESAVSSAKAAMIARLTTIRQEAIGRHTSIAAANDAPLVALASAAPGGDILFHEACAELGIPSILCLPIPAADYIREAYEAYPGWRTRFQDLMEKRTDSVLELSDRAKLPGWLADPPKSPPIDFWERGNRWVLAMARAYDPERSYLIVLWDGVETGQAMGGTAHMVQLAKAIPEVRFEPIDTKTLSGMPSV